MLEENNDLKEKVSLLKLKNALLKNSFRNYLLYFLPLGAIFLIELFFCTILEYSGTTTLPVKIIAWIFYLLLLFLIVKETICVIRVKKNKISISKDTLIDKKYMRKFIIKPVANIYGIFTYKPFKFYFAKSGKWSIPRYNYAWSEFYGPMKDEDIYEQAEISDSFYIIRIINKFEFFPLSARLFDLEGIEKQ